MVFKISLILIYYQLIVKILVSYLPELINDNINFSPYLKSISFNVPQYSNITYEQIVIN